MTELTELAAANGSGFQLQRLKARHLAAFMGLIHAFAGEERLREAIGIWAVQAQNLAAVSAAYEDAKEAADKGEDGAGERRDLIANDLRALRNGQRAAQNEVFAVLLDVGTGKGIDAMDGFVAKIRGIDPDEVGEADLEIYTETLTAIVEAPNLDSFLTSASGLANKLSSRFRILLSPATTGEGENSSNST